jgi:pseudaminic acid cytidylyltransferase
MNLAVIPARGGSKRIYKKNIKPFGGKPMIAWSVQAAQNAGIFDRIVVSTDDVEIAAVAREYGADVPFMRPAELSDDHTGTTDVIAHAIEWHVAHGYDPQKICCIYATAPFLQVEDIQRGAEILNNSGADFAFSVTSFTFPIQRAMKLRSDGRLEMFDPSQLQTRSQDLLESYHDAGQFYWGTQAAWMSNIPIFGPRSAPVMLPRYRVQDIDTPEDWQQAEALFQALAYR